MCVCVCACVCLCVHLCVCGKEGGQVQVSLGGCKWAAYVILSVCKYECGNVWVRKWWKSVSVCLCMSACVGSVYGRVHVCHRLSVWACAWIRVCVRVHE